MIPHTAGNPGIPAPPELEDLVQCLAEMRELLRKQIGLIDCLIEAILQPDMVPPDWRPAKVPSELLKNILYFMLQGAGSSCHSVLVLTEHGVSLRARDCFCIARTVIETIINICYILAAGDEAAFRMERHAKQKSFRDLDNNSIFGVRGIGVSRCTTGQPDGNRISGLREAIAEFTSKKGREVRDWTALSVEKRLEIIGHRYDWPVQLPLQSSFFAIYRHASEIIHGTYYGSLFFFGGLPIEKRPLHATAEEIICNHLFLIFTQLIYSIEALMVAYAIEFDAPAFGHAAQNVTGELFEISYLKEHVWSADDGATTP